MPSSVYDTLRGLSPTLSVGVLAADLMSLEAELSLIPRMGVELLHFDVMDGCFTPMMTVGPPFIKAVRTQLLKDVHLMIEEPLDKLDAYVEAGADILTIHAESCRHIHRVLQRLAGMRNANDPARGLVRGIALNPGTPLTVLEPLLDEVELIMLLGINPGWGGQELLTSTLSRVRQLQDMIENGSKKKILIAVDGGITSKNIEQVATTGVDIVVTGSAVFDGKTPVENARAMMETLQSRGHSGNS